MLKTDMPINGNNCRKSLAGPDCNDSMRRRGRMKKVILALFIILALFLNLNPNIQGHDHDDDDDDDHGCHFFGDWD